MILQMTNRAKKSAAKYSQKDGRIKEIIIKFLNKIVDLSEGELKAQMKPCLSPLAPFFHAHLTNNLVIMVFFRGEECVVTDIGPWEMFFGSRKKR